MDSPVMDRFCELLAETGVGTVRFEFPYMVERRETGKRRPPNRMPELQESFREILAVHQGPIFIGGKSMGGRVATMIADTESVAGVICLGYPFHPAGKPEKLRVEHLEDIQVPVLILQGSRDALGNREEIAGYSLSENISLGIEECQNSLALVILEAKAEEGRNGNSRSNGAADNDPPAETGEKNDGGTCHRYEHGGSKIRLVQDQGDGGTDQEGRHQKPEG